MSIFTRYAMDALMKTSHPEINRRQCWNLHPHRTPCTTCKDICPYGDQIFTRPNLVKDWDPCTDCGLCVSACRSGCIAPSPEQVQRDTTPADNDNDTIWIGCEKSTRKNTITRLCISALSWEALAYLALSKKIVLDLTPCGECENDLCAEQLRKELTRLVEFFGPTVFEARFTLAYELEDAPYHVKELSRREMMEQLTEGSKSGTKKLLQKLPGLRDEEDAGMDFRLLLHQRTKQLKAAMETPLRYGYYLPNVTDKCFGCGKCEKSCRANALKVEDLPDGQTRIVITPWKCGECGICVASCSNHGIDGMKLRQLTTLGPVSIYKCTKTLCADCGKPIAPDSVDGICSVCRIKRRTKKRQDGSSYYRWCCFTATNEGLRRTDGAGNVIGCSVGRQIRDDIAMDLLRRSVNAVTLDKKSIISSLTRVVESVLASGEDSGEQELRRLELELEKLQARSDAILDRFLDESISKEDYQRVKARCENEMNRVQEKIAAIKQRQTLNTDTQTLKPDIRTAITGIVSGRTADDDFYGHLLQQMTVYRDGRVEVALNLLPAKWVYVLDGLEKYRDKIGVHDASSVPMSVSRPLSSG